MGILANENAISTGGYQISNSLRFQAASTQYATRTPVAAGNRQKWTWSAWVKRGNVSTDNTVFSAGSGGSYTSITFDSTQQLYYYDNGAFVETSQVFRDPSAWYHIVVAVDTTQATASNRVKIYVNGSQVTAFGTASYPSLNQNSYINNNNGHAIGALYTGSAYSSYFDGYMAEVNFIDGQALTPSSFGATNTLTGQWCAAKYTGTYGTNGFYLPFSNGTSTTTLGADSSGNGNNWTLTNFTRSAGVSDCWMTDVPSGNGSAGTQPNSNYCVINPLDKVFSAGSLNITAGNLKVTTSQANMDAATYGSIMMSSGKYYWEVTITGGGASPATGNGYNLGIINESGSATVQWVSKTGAPVSTTYTTNDVLGFAFDATAGTIQLYKNNVAAGSPQSFAYTAKAFLYYWGNDGSTAAFSVNFGQRSFAYTPPSGFKALCTANL